MDNPELFQSPLFILIVAVAAFWLGRQSRAGGGETAEERRMRESLAAQDTFSSIDPSKQAEIDRLLSDGKLIDAIRLIRQETGVGLKEAKTIADTRRRQLKGH